MFVLLSISAQHCLSALTTRLRLPSARTTNSFARTGGTAADLPKPCISIALVVENNGATPRQLCSIVVFQQCSRQASSLPYFVQNHEDSCRSGLHSGLITTDSSSSVCGLGIPSLTAESYPRV